MSVKLKFKDSQGTNIPYDIEANNLSVTNMPLIKGKTCDWIDAKANYVTTASLNNALSANIRTKVLWAGGWTMNANQTITLSEAISSQPNGVVFVFSFFSAPSTVLNYAWNSHFVSKHTVASFSSCGHAFALHDGESVFASKYLYISDTTIKGYATNAAGSVMQNNSNIIHRNSMFVLRYVLGV